MVADKSYFMVPTVLNVVNTVEYTVFEDDDKDEPCLVTFSFQVACQKLYALGSQHEPNSGYSPYMVEVWVDPRNGRRYPTNYLW